MREVRRRKKEPSILDFAVEMYRQYGSGIIVLHHSGIGYFLPSCFASTDVIRAIISQANKHKFAVAIHLGNSLYAMKALDSSDRIFAHKLRESEDWVTRLEDFVFK